RLAREAGKLRESAERIEAANTNYPVRTMTYDIIAAEDAQLAERNRLAREQRNQFRWISLGSLTAQLVLLGVIILLAERQIRKRLVAESTGRSATARARSILQTVREPIALFDRDLRL